MFHNCEPMKEVIAQQKDYGIEMIIEIDYDEDIGTFELRQHDIDLISGDLISINAIDHIRYCPYCGARFMVYKAP